MSLDYIVIDQSWYVRPEGMPQTLSCGGVVCRLHEGAVLVALTREHNTTQYVLPKGRMEPGEDIEATARREVQEETGVSGIMLLCKLATLERLSFDKDVWKQIHYFLFVTAHLEISPTDPKHAGLAAWFPIDDLPPMLWPEQANLLRSNLPLITGLVEQWAAATR
jgi:8-oxo-dGTP pyrophosphatase MutT (NUDIX family)